MYHVESCFDFLIINLIILLLNFYYNFFAIHNFKNLFQFIIVLVFSVYYSLFF